MATSQQIDMSISTNKENFLQPSWLGKIDWSRGIPTSPEKYKTERYKIFDYWGEYKSPIWDDMYEYRKSFSNSYYNLYDNYENIANLHDKDNQFITIFKNKKTIKQYEYSSSEVNKFSITYENEIESEISDSENNTFYYNDVNDVNYNTNVKHNYDYGEDNF